MSRFEKSVEVGVPVRVAYDKWTQFEDFTRFLEGVERVVQLDDKHLRWTASIAGRRKDWEAQIVDQTPDTRIAWKSTRVPRTLVRSLRSPRPRPHEIDAADGRRT